MCLACHCPEGTKSETPASPWCKLLLKALLVRGHAPGGARQADVGSGWWGSGSSWGASVSRTTPVPTSFSLRSALGEDASR